MVNSKQNNNSYWQGVLSALCLFFPLWPLPLVFIWTFKNWSKRKKIGNSILVLAPILTFLFIIIFLNLYVYKSSTCNFDECWWTLYFLLIEIWQFYTSIFSVGIAVILSILSRRLKVRLIDIWIPTLLIILYILLVRFVLSGYI